MFITITTKDATAPCPEQRRCKSVYEAEGAIVLLLTARKGCPLYTSIHNFVKRKSGTEQIKPV
jgi:hypothetical protein